MGKKCMSDNQQTTKSPAPEPIRAAPDPGVNLAVQRTELALDRTQLAWVRTAFTLITAGLAIDKVAAVLHEARVLAGTNWLNSSHVIGIALTVAATLFLGAASVVYYQQACTLARLKHAEPPLLPLALLVSLLVILLGVIMAIFMLVWG